ncbi:hypothetical protein ERO13_A01G141200v2 [Gossypium hirsutum]|uniref:DNA polymerase n=2 Tax=Gossypium TaxID=3633 RepID=A0A1U8J4U5_GOSHI|nr:DNA polymerase lambda isoform X1 [Gossypium hirsutum]KAB2097102.1 hypothetical protein ES319_A01G148500v1 [Gossypium barbadense]KAG4214813.1 hypothetical protein ERO13_A01G141200v2 [Gossypium hirsutum]
MAPKRTKRKSPSLGPQGMFAGMTVFLIEDGVQSVRLQIWKQKLVQMGAKVETQLSEKVSHVFAISSDALFHHVDGDRLARFKGHVLLYQWLEESLAAGEKVSEDFYILKVDPEGFDIFDKSLKPKLANRNSSSYDEHSHCKRMKSSHEETKQTNEEKKGDIETNSVSWASNTEPHSPSSLTSSPEISSTQDKDVGMQTSFQYSPPDLNKGITEIFGKLVNIYRALGDDRRSFSYYKAIAVVEKLPFKVESADQVKDLPGIGKSMQDHIQEIVTTGKLSKLQHFETDEKVKTITLFGEVWGIGPATALKLYEKGHRTLDDLKNEDSLTNAQVIGLKYFDDIKTRIPRHEAQEMELVLQKVAEDIIPGMVVVCGGSYRRGKASCGDLDIVITHPDGKSHKGFLQNYVKRLKEMKLLREDLIFSTHSEEGTDSGVDTYFGLCTYPGRELRHRIDFKVYPRDIYAFGLIAWTGDDVLNRRLRLLAESKGYRLDDTGLFPATHGSGSKRGSRGTASLKLETEKEVFDFLGFPWLEPYERNL